MSETRRLFGTDGVRGTANRHPMTAELALALGKAIAHVFQRRGRERRRIIIGKDTRLSGYLFEDALAAGICSMGADVIQVGPMPTPGMAFLTADMRCHAGVMISASHNPYHDNGIKFFSGDGFKLPDEIELRIEELIASGAASGPVCDPRGDRERAENRRRGGALRRLPQEDLSPGPVARRAAHRARLRERRRLQGGAHGAGRARRGALRAGRRPERPQHQRRLWVALPRTPGRQGARGARRRGDRAGRRRGPLRAGHRAGARSSTATWCSRCARTTWWRATRSPAARSWRR